jgi:hypothetical protein
MKKEYKFNAEKNCYEFCPEGITDCELLDFLKDKDPAHFLCAECIERFEGKRPTLAELASSIKIRKRRKLEDN